MSDTATTEYTTRTTCRVCGSSHLIPLFSLGNQFISSFVPKDRISHGTRCPIRIVLCRNCTLVQAADTAPQDFLYTRHYWYRSGVTQTMRDALRDVTAAAERRVSLQPGDVVLDIGSNDGTLLRSYTAPGIVRVGVEPATNLAEEGRVGVDCLIREFWSFAHYATALRLNKQAGRWDRLPKAKVITACGMFYDLEDPNAFIADVAKALAPDGVFIAQLMCLKQTLEKGDVGNFAHEHLEYYSLESLRRLLEQHGLSICEVEENAVNGGSYRIFARKVEQFRLNSPSTIAAFAAEESMGLADITTYHAFYHRVQANKAKCVDFLREQHAQGKRIHVLGASTKGNVILQYLGLDHSIIEAASDRSPSKHGLYTVGTGIPIVSEEQSRAMQPDLYFVLPYAFLNELREREWDWFGQGGRFVVPLPQAKVVSRRRDTQVFEERIL